MSSVAITILGLWFVFSLVLSDVANLDYIGVTEWAGHTPNSVMLILLVLTLGYHSSLGIQVIVEDYVHGPTVKVVSLVLSKFTHAVVAFTAIFAVLKLAFGITA